MRTVAFCEIEPYCRAVLAKHWPDIPCFPDIRGIDSYEIGRLGGAELICGGFPCQDISVAGAGAGLAGARSGLWSEYARLIRVVRPAYVIVENVSMLLGRGLGTVLGDLAAIGYDAEWHCIPAAYVGAPHRRDRVWIVAYPGERGHRGVLQQISELWRGAAPDAWGYGEARSMADADSEWKPQSQGPLSKERRRSIDSSQAVADSECRRLETEQQHCELATSPAGARGEGKPSTGTSDGCGWWSAEPDVGRVAHGIPQRVDRLKALGNAVVPQVVEIIGRAIMTAQQRFSEVPK